jgi:alpha-galactosidase
MVRLPDEECGGSSTRVHLDEASKEVRYVSGRSVYTEGLMDGRWVGRHWAADGHARAPCEGWIEDAFRLAIEGEVLAGGWQYVSAMETGGGRGGRHHVVEISSGARPVGVRVHTLLDSTSVFTRWLDITNSSDESLALTAVSPLSGRVWAHRDYEDYPPEGLGHAFTLGYFSRSDWAWEGWFEWKAIEEGMTRIVCDKGQGFDDPYFILRNEAKGENWVGHLAWSANWKMEFDLKLGVEGRHDSLAFGLGPVASDALRVISPGETVSTPRVHLGHVSGGLDSAVHSMHDHLRRSVLPPRVAGRSHLVQYSVPADQGYPKESKEGFTEATLLRNVDIAEAIGAEMFIVDAGWWDVAGDWVPSPSRFPRGLEPVIQHARDKGLLFGLYAEVEGGRGDWTRSKVGREHPDWLGPKDVLNLARPEVAAHVESEITLLVDRYDLDLFRLDYNPLFTHEGASTPRDGFVENNYWRYYEAFNSIYETIRKKYPKLILQQAAAGGARNDLGTAARFHESYLTDGLRVPHVLQIYSGQSLALPPEVFVIGLGADGGLPTGHPENLETNLRTIFTLSTPWIFAGIVAPSLDALSPEVLDRYLHYAEIYKEFIRPLLPDCRIYHHSPISSRGGVSSSGWFAMEYASPDRSRGWATIVRMGQCEPDLYLFRPRGLARGGRYRVTFDSSGDSVAVDGISLVRDGIPVRLETVGSSELLLFEPSS